MEKGSQVNKKKNNLTLIMQSLHSLKHAPHPEISNQSIHPLVAPQCYIHLRWCFYCIIAVILMAHRQLLHLAVTQEMAEDSTLRNLSVMTNAILVNVFASERIIFVLLLYRKGRIVVKIKNSHEWQSITYSIGQRKSITS